MTGRGKWMTGSGERARCARCVTHLSRSWNLIPIPTRSTSASGARNALLGDRDTPIRSRCRRSTRAYITQSTSDPQQRCIPFPTTAYPLPPHPHPAPLPGLPSHILMPVSTPKRTAQNVAKYGTTSSRNNSFLPKNCLISISILAQSLIPPQFYHGCTTQAHHIHRLPRSPHRPPSQSTAQHRLISHSVRTPRTLSWPQLKDRKGTLFPLLLSSCPSISHRAWSPACSMTQPISN